MKKILLSLIIVIALVAMLIPGSVLAFPSKVTIRDVEEDAGGGWGSPGLAGNTWVNWNVHVHNNLNSTHIDFGYNVFTPDPNDPNNNPPIQVGGGGGSIDTTRNVFTMQNNMSSARLSSIPLKIDGTWGSQIVTLQVNWMAVGQLNTSSEQGVNWSHVHQDTGARLSATLVFSDGSKIVLSPPPNDPNAQNGKFMRDTWTNIVITK